MTAPGLIVAAPRSGAGKTTVTLAMLAALRRRGLAVQAAKAGPDYIDPAFHQAATGRPSFNLDSWAMTPALIDALVSKGAADADLLVIEGAMGLFDGIPGARRRTGASADLAASLGLPVLLVIDVSGQSQSAAAIARGFVSHDPEVRIGGIVLNRVGSERHRKLVADAIGGLEIPILGAIPRDADLVLPERHLGLVQANEHGDLAKRLARLADMAETHLDLDAIRRLAAPPRLSVGPSATPISPPGQRIALAQDAAFSFVYPHVARRMARGPGPRSRPSRRLPTRRRPRIATPAGCPVAIPSFTPNGSPGPAAFAQASRASPRPVRCMASAAATWCLARASRMAAGIAHRMAGLLSHATSFAKPKLHLGYREARLLAGSPLGEAGTRFRGHEFHYASLVAEGSDQPLLELADGEGRKLGAAGGRRGHVTGTFFHAVAKVAV